MKITLADFGLQRHPEHKGWCTGKERYRSEGAARAAIRALHRLHERHDFKGTVTMDGVVPYRCSSCSFWHVGHLRPQAAS